MLQERQRTCVHALDDRAVRPVGVLKSVGSDARGPTRKTYATEVLSLASTFIQINDAVEARANALNARGIKPLDALHLASAEEAQADYFCTCDDRLLKKVKLLKDLKTRVASPTELIQEIQT